MVLETTALPIELLAYGMVATERVERSSVDYRSTALPLSYMAMYQVPRAGFEPQHPAD